MYFGQPPPSRSGRGGTPLCSLTDAGGRVHSLNRLACSSPLSAAVRWHTGGGDSAAPDAARPFLSGNRHRRHVHRCRRVRPQCRSGGGDGQDTDTARRSLRLRRRSDEQRAGGQWRFAERANRHRQRPRHRAGSGVHHAGNQRTRRGRCATCRIGGHRLRARGAGARRTACAHARSADRSSRRP